MEAHFAYISILFNLAAGSLSLVVAVGGELGTWWLEIGGWRLEPGGWKLLVVSCLKPLFLTLIRLRLH